MKVAWIGLVLVVAGCGSASFSGFEGDPEEEDAGLDAREEPDAQVDVVEEPEADLVPSCEHQPYVGSDEPCGPGDTEAKSCLGVSRAVCHRCENGGQKSGCAAVVHVGASPSLPSDSWWCC